MYRLSSPVYEERLDVIGFPTMRDGRIDSDGGRKRGERAGDMRSADAEVTNC